MQQLMKGLKKYSKSIYPKQKQLFRELAEAQSPGTLMISYSGSLVDNALIMQTEVWELFIRRRVGNKIPLYRSFQREESTVEFAIIKSGMQNILLCRHTRQGAVLVLAIDTDLVIFTKSPFHSCGAGTCESMELDRNNSLSFFIQNNFLETGLSLRTYLPTTMGQAGESWQRFAWIEPLVQSNIAVDDIEECKFHPQDEWGEPTNQHLKIA